MAFLTPEDLSGDKLLATLKRDEEGRPVLGDYALLRKLGVGGMGAVYYGIHPRLKREVAIKILPFHLVEQEPDIVKRFLAEARMAASLESDHVVQVLDVGEDHGTHYFVMQFVAGESAGAYLKRLKSMGKAGVPESDAMDIILAATRGLALAHSKGIVHRDIKPENILIPTGKLSRAKIADLGLAKPEAHGHSFGTMSHVAMGTPGYMAPEQAEDARTAGPAADVFGMGATLYALLAGRAPFTGTSLMAVMRAAAEDDPVPLPASVNPAVRNLIAHCLEKEAKDRYANANELLAALERVKKDPQTGEAPTPAKPPGQQKRKYRVPGPAPKPRMPAWMWGAAAGVVVAIVIGIAVAAGRSSGPDPVAEAVAAARQLADAGDFEGAAAALKGVDAAEGPALVREWEKKAKEKKDKAARDARDASVRTILERIDVFEATDKFEAALAEAEEALKLDPDNARAREAKARLEGKVAGAKRFAEKMAEFERGLAEVEKLTKQAHRKDTVEAWQKVADACEAIKLAPDEAQALAVRQLHAQAVQRRAWANARDAEAAGEIEKALMYVNRAIGAAPAPTALTAYRDTLEAKRKGAADKAARKKLHDELAAGAAKEPEPAKAVELWKDALEAADEAKDKEAARAKIAELEARIAAADGARRLAELLKAGDDALAAGQLDAAAAKYLEAQKLKPDDAAAAAGLKKVDAARLQKEYEAAMAEGKACDQNRWWELAKAAYEKALAAKPGDSAAKKALAEVEKQRKASRRAISLDADGRVKMEFVLVKACTFTMGDKRGESNAAPHEVTLTRDYWIAVTETTQAQWEALMGRDKNLSFKKGADLPVENVNFDDAMQFVKKLNLRFRADVAALPTEAEWECAYKAQVKTLGPGGDEPEKLADYGWSEVNSGGETHPVAQKKPNAWGLYDMGGNVWEWNHDYVRDYKGKVTDPVGPTTTSGDRSIRGGSAMEHPDRQWFFRRNGTGAGNRGKNVGFRVVLH
jgi:formylglycine-generating enzyme required for sulfatase activity/tetratricopeptide (TPR) repeat protein